MPIEATLFEPTKTEIDLGFRPRPWQLEALSRLRPRSALVVHRRGGKTVLAVMRLIDAALRFRGVRGRFAYVAPELKQAKSVAWDYLIAYASKVPGTVVNQSELWVEFAHNNARIRLFGADDPDRLRGIYLDGVVLDEVAQMRPELWGEVLTYTLAERDGWALFIGTPKGINLFSEIYFKYLDDPTCYAAAYDYTQTGALTDDQVEEQRNTSTPQQFRQEMLCDFSASGEDSLITIDMVTAAMARTHRPETYNFAGRVIGVDVAAMGADRTVLQPRQGIWAGDPVVMNQAKPSEIASRIATAWRNWKPHAVFIDDSGGYGSGVIDQLTNLGFTPLGVQFGAAANDPRFANKRAEMWWEMRDWLDKGGSLPKREEYRIDLTGPRYDYRNARGRLQLERKEDMISRGLRSPDFGDALALTFAEPVKMPEISPFGLPMHAIHKALTDYDPYGADRL